MANHQIQELLSKYKLMDQQEEIEIQPISKKEYDEIKYSTIKYQNKELRPSREQLDVITQSLDSHMKIIACAGSGKTTTLICRIQFLIDHGVSPNTIIISTFNVEAGKNIQNRIEEIIGPQEAREILIGNIDQIAYTFKNFFQTKVEYLSVREFCREFLNFLQSPEGSKITNFYKYFFFDEFQDANNTQYEILQTFYLSGTQIIVIGDDAQNIYGWRGTKMQLIQYEIDQDVKDIQLKFMKNNYRSTPQIVNFSNQIIKGSQILIQKQMKTTNKNGDLPLIFSHESIMKQNNAIIIKLLNLLEKGVQPSNIVILSYNNLSLQFFEQALEQHNMQVEQIKSRSESSMMHAKRKIQFIALISHRDTIPRKQKLVTMNRLVLSTVHKSKGLEWEYVFLIGCNDQFFPGLNSHSLDQLQQSRRVFYVSCTRAIKELNIYFIQNKKYTTVTRFVSEIEPFVYYFFDVNETKMQFPNPQPPMVCLEQVSWITNVIMMLSEEDMNNLRINGIIPMLKPDIQIIHEAFKYQKEIEQQSLYAQFAAFIDRFVSRTISEKLKLQGGYQDIHAEESIFSVFLDGDTYEIYKKYEMIMNDQFKQQELKKENGSVDQKEFLMIISKAIESSMVMMDQEHKLGEVEGTILYQIFKEISQVAVINNIQLERVKIVQESRWPEDFKDFKKFQLAYENFQNKNLKTQDILNDVYLVSVMQGLSEQRRRLLYRNAFYSFTNKYSTMRETIQVEFLNILLSYGQQNYIDCQKRIFNQEFHLQAEIDLVLNDILFQFKCVQTQNISIEWVIHMLASAALLQENQIKINYLVLYNPLMGTLFTFNIQEWEQQTQLLAYIAKLRDLQNEVMQQELNGVQFLYADNNNEII